MALPGDVEHPVKVYAVEGAEVVADTGGVGDAPHGGTAMRRWLNHGTVVLDVLVAGAPQRHDVVMAGCSSRRSCLGGSDGGGGGGKEQEERCGQAAATGARRQLVHLDWSIVAARCL